MDVWGRARPLGGAIPRVERSLVAWTDGKAPATLWLEVARAASRSRIAAEWTRHWTVARAISWGHGMARASGRIPAWVRRSAQVCARLFAALVLGALLGPYADLGLRVPADSAFRLSMPMLLLPVLVIALRETLPRRRWVVGAICALLLALAIEGIARFVLANPQTDSLTLLVVQWAPLLLAPVVAGFALAGPRPGAAAIGVGGAAGMAAWVGVGAHHLWLATRTGVYSDTGSAGALGKVLLGFALLIFLVEVPAAAFGGLLGGAIRVWLGRAPLWELPPITLEATRQPIPAELAVLLVDAIALQSPVEQPVTVEPAALEPVALEPVALGPVTLEPVSHEIVALEAPIVAGAPTSADSASVTPAAASPSEPLDQSTVAPSSAPQPGPLSA